MKISDRDKKLILFVLLAAIICLPIFLFIRPTNTKIKDMDAELVGLNERFEYLRDLSEKQPAYEAKIKELNAERDKMISEYAGGILQENTVMFLRGIETYQYPVIATTIAFSEDEETPITEASVNDQGEYVEGLTAIKSSALVNFKGEYRNCVEMINYIFTYKEKMNISSISMELDKATNEIKGTYQLDQYAISGNGKTVSGPTIPSMNYGATRLFELIRDEEGNILTPESAKGIKVENTENDENAEVTD
ncbi:MAG: hypothetical protein K6G75_03080 [Lachnospiraceae bacterium]|nr:hypothetical protein [Lachnospiraceae bacterium]